MWDISLETERHGHHFDDSRVKSDIYQAPTERGGRRNRSRSRENEPGNVMETVL